MEGATKHVKAVKAKKTNAFPVRVDFSLRAANALEDVLMGCMGTRI